MTYPSHFPLQQSIYATLSTDATLQAMVTGIFDHVPEGSNYPFVTLGEASIRDWSNLEAQGTEQQLTLRVWSREAGRKQAAEIMSRTVALLHNANLTVTGQTLAGFHFTGSNIQLMGDGATYRGTLTFRALLNAA